MKLHFEPDLDYQRDAIEAVCALFRGQEICCTEFTVTREALGGGAPLPGLESDLGIGNRLGLLDDELLENLKAVQLAGGLRPSTVLDSRDFTVEMEPGTRRSLVRILHECGRLDDFKRNPQQFIEIGAEAINRAKRLALVDGIKYQRIGSESYYAQELFETEELNGYLRNVLDSTKSIYEQVVYDSAGVERSFAEELEKNQSVKVYAKLPGWFKVPTPLGTYNPDWALLAVTDEGERLFFVVETKGGLFTDDLRDQERGKVKCGEAHFKTLGGDNPARFKVATKLSDVLGGE